MNTFSPAKLISEKNLITTLLWCWEQIESGHFNVVMETRCDCLRCMQIPHLAATYPICWRSANYHFSQNWPACPNFLFHSVSNYIFSCSCLLATFVPPPSSPLQDDVTLTGELRNLRRKALICFILFWVLLLSWSGSRAHSLTERCLLGLVETPTQRAHFTVPVTLYPGKKSAFRIFSDSTSANSCTSCQINLQNSRRIDDSYDRWSISHKMLTDFLWHSLRFPEDSVVFT